MRVVRRIAPFVLAALLLAACGGKKPPSDPGRDVLGAFIHAAGRGDRQAMRRLLSPESQIRVSPAALAVLARRVRPLAGGFRLVVSERINDDFGLAAAVRRPTAFGAALRLVDGDWRLELGGPVRIRPLGPRPGARQRRVRQLAAAIDGAIGGGEALLYLDGFAIPDAKVYRFGKKLSIVANLPKDVPAGDHSVVVFAGSRSSANAQAWTFLVPA